MLQALPRQRQTNTDPAHLLQQLRHWSFSHIVVMMATTDIPISEEMKKKYEK
jgi:hypothetical protein